jgi:hypothetical protein
MECNQDLPEVNLVIESEDITAKTRKLKAVWSYEAQQDLRSQHNLDAEAELTAVLAQEINLEIDREVLTDLRNNAGTVAAWDFNTALGDTIKEKYESCTSRLLKFQQRRPPEDAAWWLQLARDFPRSRLHLRDGHGRFRPDSVRDFTSPWVSSTSVL